jgi:CubicO group peptidase (beta-lactamase class C family)
MILLKHSAWKTLLKLAFFLLAFLILIVTAMNLRWSFLAGPLAGQTGFFRLLSHGTTRIDDYKKYPYRELQPSAAPFIYQISDLSMTSHLEAQVREKYKTSLTERLSSSDTTAFLVIKADEILIEQYYQGYTPSSLSQVFSVTKSINSVLIGMAIDDGYFPSAGQVVTDFMPELRGKGFEAVSLAHLLTMTSGMDYSENDNPFGVHVVFNYTHDLEKMILDFRIKDEPGEKFEYKSGDTALLGLILSRALAPKTISDYAQEKLWSPLDLEFHGVWSLDREDGLEKNWCCLALTARDLAKFGRLYLHQGLWDGERLLSEQWIKDSTSKMTVPKVDWAKGLADIGIRNYGYSWWLLSENEGDFLALGKDGQFLYVNPSFNVIIVRYGWSMGGISTRGWIDLFQFLAREAG